MSNFLQEIETKYPVGNVLVNGRQVWPYLRISYLTRYHVSTSAAMGEGLYRIRAPLPSQRTRLPSRLRSLLHDTLYGCWNWFGRYEYVALTRSDRRLIDGRYVDRFVDPIIDELGRDKVLCIEYPRPLYPISSVYTRRIVSANALWPLRSALLRLRTALRREYTITNKGVLDDIGGSYGLEVDATLAVKAHETSYTVFRWLFRALHPRALILYQPHRAAIRAAKDLGITVIEVQHGAISTNHTTYNVYCDIDRSCFPDHLLVLGNSELDVFCDARFIDPRNVHPVGSYYIDHIKATYIPDPQLSARLSVYKRVVGVTLQWTFAKRLIGFICEAAKLDGDVFYILIPRRRDDAEYAAAELPPNVTVIKDKDFYELMAYCDFHSTVNSTCALEAPSLGVQNVLVDIDGAARAHYGKPLRDHRVTRFADTPGDYLDVIGSFTRLDREAVCKLNEQNIATNYQKNIRSFIRTHLSRPH